MNANTNEPGIVRDAINGKRNGNRSGNGITFRYTSPIINDETLEANIDDVTNAIDMVTIMKNRFGADSPMTQLAVTQAKHAGVTVDFTTNGQYDSWGFPLRDEIGNLVGHYA